MYWINCFFLILGFADAPQAEVPDLADALWQGTATIQIEGHLRNQYLSNKVNKRGVPTGFHVEKANLNLNMSLLIHFLVNAKGDCHLLTIEAVDANCKIDSKETKTFIEERVMESGLRAPERINQVEKRITNIRFSKKNNFQSQDGKLEIGEVSIAHEGKMRKRGKFSIDGKMHFKLKGKGNFTFTSERRPRSEEKPDTAKAGNATLSLPIQLQFSGNLAHKKKPVNTSLSVTLDVSNPFVHPKKSKASTQDSFQNKLVGKGSVEFKPLFGKKR